jgi:GT2 family glycosyltransferase
MTGRVGAVVLNYNGGDATLACLHSLRAAGAGPAELHLVLVDNASDDDVVPAVRRELPDVEIVESPTNRGFAGGCNLGIRSLPEVDYVALVNNDATVDRGWLAPLIAALAGDPGLGAAAPKLLFAGQFVDLALDSPTAQRGRGDRRDLGVLVDGARVGGRDVWARAQPVSGFWGPEPSGGGRWAGAHAELRVPVPSEASPVTELRLAALRPVRVTVTSGGERAELDLGPTARWCPVRLGGAPVNVVNNAGTELVDRGYGADRGYLAPDDGRYDAESDVFAWSGGAVLLRRRYLDEVGLFDERLFLYYEDLELSWRGRRAGWRYRYVPTSTVRHLHAATTGRESPAKRYFDERNRLLVLTRHAPATVARRAPLRYLLSTASYARRDVVSPLLHGSRPRPGLVATRVRAFLGYLRRLPGMVRSRRGDGRRGLRRPEWQPAWDEPAAPPANGGAVASS